MCFLELDDKDLQGRWEVNEVGVWTYMETPDAEQVECIFYETKGKLTGSWPRTIQRKVNNFEMSNGQRFCAFGHNLFYKHFVHVLAFINFTYIYMHMHLGV